MHELSETSRLSSKIDYLIRLGLGKDPDALTYYRKAVNNPQMAVNTAALRPYLAEVTDNILDLVFSDAIIWGRVKTLLLKRHHTGGTAPELGESALRNLKEKAASSNTSLEVLVEVYNRGFLDSFGTDKSPNQGGFSRVNSFISGGKAREMDKDLIESSKELNTPKQGKTLEVIKKVIRDKR